MKAFEPSSCAARALGPYTTKPSASSTSARPAQRGASGPTTIRSGFTARATSRRSPDAFGAVPALPGQTTTDATLGDASNASASACSRPPLPITRTLRLLDMGAAYCVSEAVLCKNGSVSEPIVLRVVRPYDTQEEFLSQESWTIIDDKSMILVEQD